jgi:hypothetical protein
MNKSQLNNLDKSELADALLSLASRFGVKLQFGRDPDGKPALQVDVPRYPYPASPSVGTFVLTNISKLPVQRYIVKCQAEVIQELTFDVVACSAEEAEEMCRNREDKDGNYVHPNDVEHIETLKEDQWETETR